MTFVEAFYRHIASLERIQLLAGRQVFPVTVPEGIDERASHIVYAMESEAPLSPEMSGPGTLWQVEMTVVSQSVSHVTAHEMADALRDGLVGVVGMMGGSQGVQVGPVEQTDRGDAYEAKTKLYQVQQVFRAVYQP